MLNYETEYKSLKKALIETQERVQKEADRNKKINEELEHRKKNYDNTVLERDKKKKTIEDLLKIISTKQSELESVTKDNDEYTERIENYLEQQEDMTEQFKRQKISNAKLLKERNDLEQQRLFLKSTINKATTKLKSMSRDKNDAFKEMKGLQNELQEAKRDQEIDRNNLIQLDKEILDTKKVAVSDRKLIRELANKKGTLRD